MWYINTTPALLGSAALRVSSLEGSSYQCRSKIKHPLRFIASPSRSLYLANTVECTPWAWTCARLVKASSVSFATCVDPR